LQGGSSMSRQGGGPRGGTSSGWQGGGSRGGGGHGGGSNGWRGGSDWHGGHGGGGHGHGGWHGGHWGGWRGGYWGGYWPYYGYGYWPGYWGGYWPYYGYSGGYYAPSVAYDDRAVYAEAATSYAAPAAVEREVVYPHGRYVLEGDGVSTAYRWIWIPNPPAAPPERQ
jgi:hypothetical protein